MIPAIYNYPPHYRGDTLDSFTINLSTDGTPTNLEGVTLRAQYRKPFNGATVREISIGAGITVSSPASGTVIIDKFVCNFDPGSYVWDLEFTLTNGDIKTYLRGTINIINDRTI
jgi:hypothetical protein|tara:strand:- start:3511 stop:3852 length:342 start_codon:yes stop_codon:yes gene_type:complete